MIIETRESRVEQIVAELSDQTLAETSHVVDRLQRVEELVRLDCIRTYEPLLPLCLSLHGSPYSLKNYYPFSPMFNLVQPVKVALIAGRQTSKSQTMATTSVMRAGSMPNYRILHVTPLFEQIRRFSSNYVRPLIDDSPVRPLWVDKNTNSSVLQRSLLNQSTMFFSFASTSSNRLRGLAVHQIAFDEIQDLDPAVISIANECMSAAQTYKASSIYGGTPKTLDNLAEATWRDSSQAEWVMQCQHCNYYNIPALEFDLDKMVGPYHDDISEKEPAVVCAKCRKPLQPRLGEWVHREPSRRWGFSGFHIPQIILPLHYADPSKWATLLAKQNGSGNMTRARFLNEVMGVSVDFGQKLVSETELKRASDLPWKRTARPNHDLMAQSDDYHMKVLAVDWGGGGDQGVSFTVVAVLGYLPSGEIHVIWAKRMVQSTNHVEEANEIRSLFNAFRCHYIAHDYTGAGTIRETVLVGSGVPAEKILPIEYIGAAAGSIIRFIPASLTHGRDRYRLDKTRSLLTLCTAIRYRMVRFFEYDYYSADEKGLISDFLALIENKTPSRTGSDIYTIVRNPNLTDDFAQAVNIGCAAIWHSNNAWPDFSAHYQQQTMSADQMAEIGDPDSNDWTGTGTPQLG